MTIQLVKMLIWGKGDVGDISTIEEESVEIEENDKVNQEEEEKEEDESSTEEGRDESPAEEEEEEEEEEEDSYPDYPHSRINFDFYKLVEESGFITSIIYGGCLSMMACFVSLPLYVWVVDMYDSTSMSVMPYNIAISYSNVSRLPYIPAFLLSISYLYPSMITTLDHTAVLTRLVLWFQFSFQLFASFGEMIEKTVFEETCIILGLTISFSFFRLTTSPQIGELISVGLFSTILSIIVIGYLLYGINYTAFMFFGIVLSLKPFLSGAFGLVTYDGITLLYSVFTPALIVFAFHMISTSFTPINNIMLYQILGGAMDIVLISPRPGKYLI